MKLKIINLNKTQTQTTELPRQFYEPIREDIIKRAFLVIQSNKRQPYGTNPEAGKRASAELSRRRRKYRGSYGLGISRVPRKILSRRGTRMNWVGAFAPGTVGGRRAHPPKAEKKWSQKINKDERRKAIRSALAATMNLDAVQSRGHNPPEGYPFIISDEINKVDQTKKLKETLTKLGFKEEMFNAKKRDKKGLLLVSTTEELKKSCSNIPGFEMEAVSNLNVELLAPGGHPGRLTLFTISAIKELGEKKLFTKEFKEEKKESVKKVTGTSVDVQKSTSLDKPKKEAFKPIKTKKESNPKSSPPKKEAIKVKKK